MASYLWFLGDWRFNVALAAVLLALLYRMLTWNFDYWKKRGFPEVKNRPLPFFGHTWKMMLGIINFNSGFTDLYHSMGDQPYAGFMSSMNPALLVKDPEIIKHILIKDSHIFLDRAFHSSEENDPLNGKGLFNLRGRKWKEMRARLSPTFTSGRMKAMFPLMIKCGDEMVISLKNGIKNGKDLIEIKDLTSSYTMDVIAACAFGIDCDAMKNPQSSEFRRMGKLLFKPTFKRSIMLMIFFLAPRIMEILGIKFTMEETAVFFRNFVKNLVEAREKAIEEEEQTGKSTKQYGDFIHLLVLLKKRGLNHVKYETEENEEENNFILDGEQPSWAAIELDDITAQVMSFFSAGFETSSTLLSFALYELSVDERGKRIQEELRKEIRNVMRGYDGKLTYEGIKKMHLLDRIMCETLRLYPPAGLLNRRNTKEYTIPGTNYVLEPMTQVFIPTSDMQHDPKYFPDPMRFDPDRFLPENRDDLGHYIYLPFGDGPRHCIGQRFAELQARVGMCFLVNNFEFNVNRDKTCVPIKFDRRAFILTPAGGIWLNVKAAEPTQLIADSNIRNLISRKMASILRILGDWRFIVALIAVTLALLYRVTTFNFDYWRKRGIPEVKLKPVPFFGHSFKVMVGLVNFNCGFSDIYNSMGDQPFVGIMQSMNPALLVKDPEIIKHILIKDSHIFLDRAFHTDEENDPLNGKGLFNLRGRKWKEMRTRISPTFTSGRMKAMFPLMLKCADEMVISLKNQIQGGESVVEVKDLTSNYTMDVIALCGFGVECGAVKNPESSEFKRMGKMLFEVNLKRSIVLMIFFLAPKLMEILGIQFTIEETAVFFRKFVKNLVEAREKALDEEEKAGVTKRQYADFIHHLVLIKKRGLSTLKDDNEEEHQIDLEGEQPSWASIDLDDITAQAMQFFSAGFETTSSLTSFALFELSATEHGKKIQKDLRSEIRNVIKEYDGKLTYEGIMKMHLLDRILCETLRMYPPVGGLSRRNTKEYTLPGTNHVLEPLTQIFIATHDMQHDPKYFSDPMRFDPDRFLPENKEILGQFRYIPFGDGPRHCIGQRFAELQTRVGMCFLIKNFEFEVCTDKTRMPLTFSRRAFILTASGGVWLKVKPIEQ
ncbi:uncharacterized protein LOC124174160 [Ischnura elegans]|uniref:uncharacterized protein LOC124174160 n=1 Tax=Ischnura elegans TaxID=197161 RepID=UPI001ED88DBE|nr:uncharacterized protein LOC124174160 [Ischnura elegans]